MVGLSSINCTTDRWPLVTRRFWNRRYFDWSLQRPKINRYLQTILKSTVSVLSAIMRGILHNKADWKLNRWFNWFSYDRKPPLVLPLRNVLPLAVNCRSYDRKTPFALPLRNDQSSAVICRSYDRKPRSDLPLRNNLWLEVFVRYFYRSVIGPTIRKFRFMAVYSRFID